MTERHQTQRFIRIALTLILLVILFGYTAYEIKQVVFGPRVVILSPKSGTTLSTSSVEIIGTAKNIQNISIDDQPISIDEKGNFDDEVFLSPGYNIVTLKANDRFGSQTVKTLELIYKQ
jgi:hypothetical protein